MKRVFSHILVVVILLSACSTSNVVEPIIAQELYEQDGTPRSIMPIDYDGMTEFVISNQTILPLRDSKSITELYTGIFEDGTKTVFQIKYDAAWVRQTTGLSFNSTETPELFDIAKREYNGFWLDTNKLYYQKVKAGDIYEGYNVKEAITTFESLSGNVIHSTITFDGNISLKGTLSLFMDGLITFRPFSQGNAFLPILSTGDGVSLVWSDEYAQVDDNGLAYYIADNIDDPILSKLSDAEKSALPDDKKLDVEIKIAELTLTFNDNASSVNSCKIDSMKLL